MKKINKILVIFFILLFTNNAQSEKHNQVSVELDRIKNDIIDLQKFVYKNDSSLNNSNDSNDNIELDELKILIKMDLPEKRLIAKKTPIGNPIIEAIISEVTLIFNDNPTISNKAASKLKIKVNAVIKASKNTSIKL